MYCMPVIASGALAATSIVCMLAAAQVGARLRSRARAEKQVERTARDMEVYRVSAGQPDSQLAAEVFSELAARSLVLIKRLTGAYGFDAPASQGGLAVRVATAKLAARYSPRNLSENSPLAPSPSAAYALGKKSITLCVRTGQDTASPFHDYNTLTFVLLHELAHLAIEPDDHSAEFWATFRWLLLEAAAAGVYTLRNYAVDPVDYCGMAITYCPAHDASVRPL